MRLQRFILIICAGVLLFAGGFGFRGIFAKEPSQQSGADSKKYPLLAKRLFIEEPNDPIINFAPLRQQMRQYFTDNKLEGSVYFEYLPTGTSIRISGDEQEVAASLIKLPAAMDLYKAAELGKIDLDKKITLQPGWLDSAYGELYRKGPGYQLSLREAAKIMLEQSDNTALKAIAGSTSNALKPEERALNSLDADITQNPDFTVSISARTYSSFLKCLYFSCYLNHSDSQELLTYLASSKFDDRLIAGIDNKNITVSHKIGVANTATQSDCGIVYVPNRNYALCVMINGQDNSTTNKHISALSKLAFQYISKK